MIHYVSGSHHHHHHHEQKPFIVIHFWVSLRHSWLRNTKEKCTQTFLMRIFYTCLLPNHPATLMPPLVAVMPECTRRSPKVSRERQYSGQQFPHNAFTVYTLVALATILEYYYWPTIFIRNSRRGHVTAWKFFAPSKFRRHNSLQ